MAYLTTDDLKGFLDEREIAALKRDYETDGTDKMPIGISYSENYTKDRLSPRFDIAAEFAKTGDTRSTTLMEAVAHIAVWKLSVTFPTIQLDGKRHYNYEQSLKTLDNIASGKLVVGLTELAEPTNTNGIVYGHNDDLEIQY